MKLLRAIDETQGTVPGDFTFVPDGELVFFGSVCDTDLIKGNAGPGSCGCARSFTGLETKTGTTTARVVADPMEVEELAKAIHRHLVAAGWGQIPDLAGMARDLAEEVRDAAAPLAPGTIVGRRFDDLVVRG